MFEVAELIGHTLKRVIADVTTDPDEESNYYCNLLVGGQIKGSAMQLYHIYPQEISFALQAILLTFR